MKTNGESMKSEIKEIVLIIILLRKEKAKHST